MMKPTLDLFQELKDVFNAAEERSASEWDRLVAEARQKYPPVYLERILPLKGAWLRGQTMFKNYIY